MPKPLAAGGQRAAVMGGSLVAFAAGLTAQEQADVFNSLAFSQNAANAQYNRLKEPGAWLNAFGLSLVNLDWEVDEDVFNATPPNRRYYDSLEQAALEHLKVLKSASLITLIKRTLAALNLDGFAMRVLTSQSGAGNLSSVQYVPCERRGDKGSYMYVSLLHVTALSSNKKPVLNAQKRAYALEVLSGGIGFYLKHEAYALHRERVLQDLNNRALVAIQELEL